MGDDEIEELRQWVEGIDDFPDSERVVERAREYYEGTPLTWSRARTQALRDFLFPRDYTAEDIASVTDQTVGGTNTLMSDVRTAATESRELVWMTVDGCVSIRSAFSVQDETGYEDVWVGEYVDNELAEEYDQRYVVFRERYDSPPGNPPREPGTFQGIQVDRYETERGLIEGCLESADTELAERLWTTELEEAGLTADPSGDDESDRTAPRSSEEAVARATEEVEHLVAELELPDGVEQFAKVIVDRWADENRLESRPVVVNAAAAVVVAAREEGYAYNPRDVAPYTSEDVERKYIGRAETDMVSELDIGESAVARPEDYLDRFGSQLEVDDDVIGTAERILDLAREGDETVFSGRSPSAAAGAALWIAARLHGEPVTQASIKETANVCTVSIRDMADSVLRAVLVTGRSLAELMTTEKLDSRLRQRLRNTVQSGEE